jgi:hypothetical protein
LDEFWHHVLRVRSNFRGQGHTQCGTYLLSFQTSASSLGGPQVTLTSDQPATNSQFPDIPSGCYNSLEHLKNTGAQESAIFMITVLLQLKDTDHNQPNGEAWNRPGRVLNMVFFTTFGMCHPPSISMSGNMQNTVK